jgi:hypothetical protein
MGNIVSVIMLEKEFDRKMKMLRVKISEDTNVDRDCSRVLGMGGCG